jgi:hypothetical protein
VLHSVKVFCIINDNEKKKEDYLLNVLKNQKKINSYGHRKLTDNAQNI